MRTHLGFDMGHCESMIFLRLEDGRIIAIVLDCAGSEKISTALAFFTLPDCVKSDIHSTCTLIGAALSGYETLLHLSSQTPDDLKTQEFQLLLEEMYVQQHKGDLCSHPACQNAFFVPVPCAADELPDEIREALLQQASAFVKEGEAVTLYQADFSPVCQYFKKDPLNWDDPCTESLTYRELMQRFVRQALKNARIYNEEIAPCSTFNPPSLTMGCPAEENWLDIESIGRYTELVREASIALYQEESAPSSSEASPFRVPTVAYTEVEICPEPMAALLSALSASKGEALPRIMREGILIDDHGSLTSDYCVVAVRRSEDNVLQYCRVKGASDHIGGHLIETEMLLRVLRQQQLKSSDLRPGDRSFALQTLRSWKEQYCLGKVPAAFDARELPLRLRDGRCIYAKCSVEDLVWASVHKTPIEQDKSWQKLVFEHKQSVWQRIKNQNLPCSHVALTGGVNNMSAVRHIARDVYEGADIQVERDTSLSVAEGLCRALHARERALLKSGLEADIPFANPMHHEEDEKPPMYYAFYNAMSPHVSRILMQAFSDLVAAKHKFTQEEFTARVSELAKDDQQLNDAIFNAIGNYALDLFSFIGEKALHQLPDYFPGCLPSLSVKNTFPDLLRAQCRSQQLMDEVVKEIFSRYFTTFAFGPHRQKSLLRYISPGAVLETVMMWTFRNMNFANRLNVALCEAFIPYIIDRITYAHFDADQ